MPAGRGSLVKTVKASLGGETDATTNNVHGQSILDQIISSCQLFTCLAVGDVLDILVHKCAFGIDPIAGGSFGLVIQGIDQFVALLSGHEDGG